MKRPVPTQIQRWRFDAERMYFEVQSQPDHVSFSVTEYGHEEEASRLGLSAGGESVKIRKIASAFRELAETLDAACDDATRRAVK